MHHRLSTVLLLVVLCASILVSTPVALAQEGTDDPGEMTIQADVTTVPLDAKKHGGIAYFLFDTQKKIKRFNMQTGTWLPDITSGPLQTRLPARMAVDDSGLYVSFGTQIYRYNLDGSSLTLFYTSTSNVQEMVLCGSYLYTFRQYNYYPAEVYSIDKSTGLQVNSKGLVHYLYGAVGACAKGRIYAGAASQSPSDTVYIEINGDGSFGSEIDSPYHGEHYGSQHNYLSVDGNRLVNEYGEVFNAVDLVYTGQLSYLDDLDFRIDQPIALYSGEIIGYTRTLAETGRYRPTKVPFKVFTNGSAIYAFSISSAGLAAEPIPASKLRLPTAGQPINPVNLKYRPDAVVVDNAGIVYLLDRNNFSLYRWSIPDRKYLSNISLADAALHMAYDSDNNRLYLDYPNKKITQINLSASLQETAFATTPNIPCALTTADEFVLLCIKNSPKNRVVYNTSGDLVSDFIYGSESSQIVWNGITRRAYFLDSDIYPSRLTSQAISDTGMIGNQVESGYFEDGTMFPIRITHDGSKVLLGTGKFYDATTLTETASLPNPVSDAAWSDSTLYTIYSNSIVMTLQKWSTNLTLVRQTPLIGEPGFLFNISEGLLAITYNSGYPVFSIWTTDLEQLFPEFSWNYLPVCAVDYCPDFLDNFNNDSGWPVGENNNVLAELLNGDFRVMVKNPGWIWAFASPSCPRKNYTVETAVRWENPGYSYSVLFGIDETMDHFYLLDVDPLNRTYAVYYYNGSYFYEVTGVWFSSAIKTGNQWNSIKVQVYETNISIYINDQRVHDLPQMYGFDGKTWAGLSVTSGDGGYADARFSHFWVENLYEDPIGIASLSEASHGSEGSSYPRPDVQFNGIDAPDHP